MRASVLVGPEKIVIESVPRPSIGPNSLGVRIESCGVCASNIPPWEGRPWFQYPFSPGALGHEATGIIEEIGNAVTGWEKGERVSLLSQNSFAEYDVVESHLAVRLPKYLNNKLFPGEPIGCAMNVFKRAAIKKGDLVCVVGVGFLGALLVQLALHCGAKVIAMGKRATALKIAASYGAETIFITGQASTLEEYHKRLGARLCDVVIEATGKAEPLELAAELTRERGRLVIAGYHQDGRREINMQMWNWRGLDVINAHEREAEQYVRGIETAIQAVENRELDYLPLITHRFPLEELSTALRLTRDRPEGFMKAVVTMEEPK